MKTQPQLIGGQARLPDGELVTVEEIYDDGYAAVRRTQGPMAGTIAICAVSSLENEASKVSEPET